MGQRATGNSPALHLDLKLVNRSGNVIRTATAHSLGGYSVHGTGYFTDKDGVSHLYLFAVNGFTAHVFDYNIDDVWLYRTYDVVNESNAKTVSVYPNPASDRVWVESESTVDAYEVYDMTGALVLRHEAGNKAFSIDVSMLPAGTYLLYMRSKGTVQTERFIKK